MQVKLEALAPQLVQCLNSSCAETRKKTVLIACEYAVSRGLIQIEVLEEALSNLRGGRHLSHPVILDLKNRLSELAGEFKEAYNQALEMNDDEQKANKLLTHARVVSAVLNALDFSEFNKAADAIYEAAMTFADPQELLSVVLDFHAQTKDYLRKD